MKKEEYYMIREYNGMSISVTTIYAKNSGEAESMARINGIKYDFILETKLIKQYGKKAYISQRKL